MYLFFRTLGLGLFLGGLAVYAEHQEQTYANWWVRRWAALGAVAGAVLYLEVLAADTVRRVREAGGKPGNRAN